MVMSLWIEVLNSRERREDAVEVGEHGLGLILFDINIMLHFNLVAVNVVSQAPMELDFDSKETSE